MMTFVASALQMGHELKAHYMTTGRDSATHSILWRDHGTRQIFTCTAFYAFCIQFTETW